MIFAGDADPFFHLVEVFGEGAAAGGGEAVLGAGDAAFKKFHAGNVLRFFELAGVDAEVAVGGLEDALEVVEAEGVVGGEGADDAEANAFVDQAIEFGEFGGARNRIAIFFRSPPAILLAGFLTTSPARTDSCFACLRDGRGLATVTPGDEESEEDVESAEACGEKLISPGERGEDGDAAEQHEAHTHDGDDAERRRSLRS